MNAKTFSRTSLFWLILIALCFGSIGFALRYFYKTFPVITLDLTMDRAQALNKARELAQLHQWGPADYQQAVTFSTDEETKNFIELEAGGKEELAHIIKEEYYSPYTWHVRHFREQEARETHIAFAPDGKPVGFKELLPEKLPGAALSAQEAKELAEKSAHEEWSINFEDYVLIEQAQETKLSGRIDHTFVYKHRTKKVGNADYRLTLTVSGEALTALSLSVQVPEAFKRRYEHMRSANNTIAFLAQIAMILLYFFGGCLGALLYFTRRKWVLWRPAFAWSTGIAFLLFLASLSQFPSLWMYYDTAVQRSTFIINIMISFVSEFAYVAGTYGIIIAAAEALSRKAFPHHIQLWRVWQKDIASTYTILGKTIGGYLAVGPFMAFVIAAYFFALRYLGWWMPSSTLIDPNIVAHYVPWLSAIAGALGAGFMEECLFRAIPLASAALLAQRYGHRTTLLISACILQALIFGAAHANYPAQPAYARLLELIIPSFSFGFVYLAYGLLPGIITHFTYDVVWMSLPLFFSSAASMIWSKILVILLTSVPLFIVVIARIRTGSWYAVSSYAYNAAWQAPQLQATELPKKTIDHVQQPERLQWFVWCAGIVGIVLWLIFVPKNHDSRPLYFPKNTAYQTTREILAQKYPQQFTDWYHIVVNTTDKPTDQHAYIWQENRSYFKNLLGNYLTAPAWQLQTFTFNGPIPERVEKLFVTIDQKGNVQRLKHQLPETRQGAMLTEQEARKVVHDALPQLFQKNPEDLKEISAISYKKPDRIDWLFIFQDKQAYPSDNEHDGQARIGIELAGDTVTDYYRSFHIPDEWQRTERQKETLYGIISIVCKFIIGFLFIFALSHALQLVIHRHLNSISFLIFFLIISIASILHSGNALWLLFTRFSTGQPLTHQLMTRGGIILLKDLIITAFFALLASFFTTAHFRFKTTASFTKKIFNGFLAGSFYVGIVTALRFFLPHSKPLWPDFSEAATIIPSLGIVTSAIVSFIFLCSIFYCTFYIFDRVSAGGTKRLWVLLGISLLFGIGLSGMVTITTISEWLITGCTLAGILLILYYFLIRYQRSIIPPFAATVASYGFLQQIIFSAFPGVFIGFGLAICAVLILSIYWLKLIAAHDAQ